jgi:DNA-directed RNA polymerase subunit RPC12/RpoP
LIAAGIIESKTVEIILSIISVLVLVGLVFLGAGLGLLLGIPYFLVGLIVGFVSLVVIISGSLGISKEIVCQNCRSKQKVIRNIVSYQCPACGHRNKITTPVPFDN